MVNHLAYLNKLRYYNVLKFLQFYVVIYTVSLVLFKFNGRSEETSFYILRD